MATPATPTSRKFFAKLDDTKSIWLSVRPPTRREIEAADLEFSAKFNDCLQAGLPTRSRLMARLRKNGMWTTEQESEMVTLRDEGIDLENQIEADKFATEEAKATVKARHREVLNQLNALRNDIETMLSHTSDAKSEDARRDCLMACTVEYSAYDGAGAAVNPGKGGTRLWPQIDDMLNETNSMLMERAYYEFMMYTNGQPSGWDKLMAPAAAPAAPPATAPEAPVQSATPTPPAPAAAPDGEQEAPAEAPADAPATQPAL